MVRRNDNPLNETAKRLDRLRWVPTEVLAEIVQRDGLCFWAPAEEEPPEPSSDLLEALQASLDASKSNGRSKRKGKR